MKYEHSYRLHKWFCYHIFDNLALRIPSVPNLVLTDADADIVAERQGVHFMDAAECEFNEVDFMHLTCKGHARLAELLTAAVPKLV